MTPQQTADPSTEKQPPAMQVLFPARRRSLAGMAWALRTWLEKKRITLEDRLGLFRYSDWIRTIEQPAVSALLQEAKSASGDPVRALFVAVVETFSQAQLDETLQSLRLLQSTNWTLVLFLPKNISQSDKERLRRLDSTGSQVCLIQVDASLDLNRGGWQAQLADLPGDWVVPLRLGDRISPAWPVIFRLFLQRFPRADVLYWDEDEYISTSIDPGSRARPFLKPDWSPELLFSLNFIESAAFRKSYLLDTAKEKGLLPAAYSVQQAARIPVILQHRARLPQVEKDALQEQYRQAAQSCLEGLGLENVQVLRDSQGDLRVSWKTPDPLVSIIIPTRENLNYLQRCLTSLIERTQGVSYEIILMDDHSSSPEVLAYYRELESRHANITVHHNQDAFNYSRVNNQGARLANGSLLLFLNNDVEILNGDWLAEMARWAQLPGVGMVGARLLYPDKSIQHAGIVPGMTGHAAHLYAGRQPFETNLFLSPDFYRDVFAVTGACMLVRRAVFEQVGGFDEELILVFNDVDLCLRAREAGWRIVYTPAATLIHYEGRSRSRYMPPRDLRLGAQRLAKVIAQGDPYYHPGLSLAVNRPSLRRPWEPDALARLNNIIRLKG